MFGFLKAVKMHTFRMFLTHYSLLKEKGATQKESIKGAVDFFRHREPFDQLADKDVEAITETISNLSNPQEVGAAIFQKCDGDHKNLRLLQKQETLTRWALTEDVEASIISMVDAAKVICADNPGRSIMDGLAYVLAKRDGWQFSAQHPDRILFKYRGTLVSITSQNTGTGVVKEVIRSEFAHRVQNPANLVDWYIRKSVISHFDEFFDGVWNEFKSRGGRG